MRWSVVIALAACTTTAEPDAPPRALDVEIGPDRIAVWTQGTDVDGACMGDLKFASPNTCTESGDVRFCEPSCLTSATVEVDGAVIVQGVHAAGEAIELSFSIAAADRRAQLVLRGCGGIAQIPLAGDPLPDLPATVTMRRDDVAHTFTVAWSGAPFDSTAQAEWTDGLYGTRCHMADDPFVWQAPDWLAPHFEQFHAGRLAVFGPVEPVATPFGVARVWRALPIVVDPM